MIRVKNQSRKQVIDLDGPDGNAFVLLGIARGVLRKGGSNEYCELVLKEMQSSDYNNLVKTFDKYLGEYFTLETSNKELLYTTTSLPLYGEAL